MDMMQKLRKALAEIRKCNYQIREEWLNGSGGGLCEIHGRRFFFLDASLPLGERLEQAEASLAKLRNFAPDTDQARIEDPKVD